MIEKENNQNIFLKRLQELNEQIQKLQYDEQILQTKNFNQKEQFNQQINSFHESLINKDNNIKCQTNKIEQLNQKIQQLENENQLNKSNIKIQLDLLNEQIIQHNSENLKLKQELDLINKLTQQKNAQIIKQSSEYDEKLKFIQLQKDIEIQKYKKLIEEINGKLKNSEEGKQKLEKSIEQINIQLISANFEKQDSQRQSDIYIEQLNKQLIEEQKKITQIKIDSDNCISGKDQFILKLKQEINLIQNDQESKYDEINKLKENIKNNNKQIYLLKSKENQNKQEIKQETIVSHNERPYEIINEQIKKQEDCCQAISFNNEQTIMVAGCGKNLINLFEFKQGQLNQKQILNDHTSGCNIYTLYFMTKSNQFISGTDKEIEIWDYNNTTSQYYCLQMLKQAHSGGVNRVIMNKNEDLIISCSSDKTIKFWIKQNEWECSQSLTNHTYWVYDICLNSSCTQLVSCGQDKQILISQQDGNQKWSAIQIIQGDGVRICYIDDSLIAFQPWQGKKIEIYQLNQYNKQFVKFKDVTVQNDSNCDVLFPMIFNRKKQLLLNKNCHRVNLIRKQNNDFIVEQSINFGTYGVFGAMTDDFSCLITWDNQSKEFQVRKQK